jgi:Coenzyme PQQ synthesis protein D (PqqD)
VTTLRLRKDAVRWREIDREVVAIDLDSSMYLGTNESGVRLWRRLAEGATTEQLVDELVSAFGIEPERATADVHSFLDEFEARNLLERE